MHSLATWTSLLLINRGHIYSWARTCNTLHISHLKTFKKRFWTTYSKILKQLQTMLMRLSCTPFVSYHGCPWEEVSLRQEHCCPPTGFRCSPLPHYLPNSSLYLTLSYAKHIIYKLIKSQYHKPCLISNNELTPTLGQCGWTTVDLQWILQETMMSPALQHAN